jgi:O-Antigen ligase
VPTWVLTLLTAGVLCFVAFYAGGGLRLARMTTLEIALTLGSALIMACALLLGPARARWEGLWPVGLLLAFAALTALSVAWSVQPDDSFKDAGRMLAYSAVFAAAVVLAGVTPRRWPALLGGVTLAAVVVCGYALLTKVFPDQLDASDIYARLRAPYSYWNAIGLTAAIGAIGCMWLGARRAGHGLLSALAYPAMGLMLVTLLLAYSRGALVALALGLALWFCIVPLRLRGAAVLLAGAVAATGVVAWDFSTHALSTDNVALADRTAAGNELGALLAAMLVLLALAGIAVGFLTGRRAPSRRTRRRAGTLLVCLLAVAVVGFFGALAASHRGLTGSISHDLRSLTNPHAPIPPNTPGRLTAVGSVRARYWNEALKVFKAHPAVGAGAEGYATARLRYRTETLDVRHAHGYLVQTLADLGLIGLALTLVLLVAWMAAAGRCTHPFNRRWTSWGTLSDWRSGSRPRWRRWRLGERPAPYTPERIAMLSLLCVVVAFGVHSLADWTWYVPGNACVALICAGWLAGRGPLERAGAGVPLEERNPNLAAGAPGPGEATEPRAADDSSAPSSTSLRERLRTGELRPIRAVVAGAVIVAALLAAWAQWQPQRSSDASQQALALLTRYPGRAEAAAQAAVARDPLSAQALLTLATVQQANGLPLLARGTLQRAVHLQPSNPQTWLALGEYDLAHQPLAARNELAAAIYLNPEWIAPEAIAGGNPEAIAIQNSYVQALRMTTLPPTPATARGRSR